MSDRALAQRQSTLPGVPTRQELEALGPGDRWTLEERLGDAQTILRDFNDDELRQWIEVEGVSQAEAGRRVGRSQQRIAQRCARAGIKPASNRGRPRITTPCNSDAEVIDAEVVEDDPQSPPPTPAPVSGPAYGPPPASGPRSSQHQERLISSVAGRMEDIQMSIGEINLATAAEAMTEGDRTQCLLQLRSARTAVSQLIQALE